MSVIVVPTAVNPHNTGAVRSVLQFRRSKMPVINVVLSGVRVNAPSDTEKQTIKIQMSLKNCATMYTVSEKRN